MFVVRLCRASFVRVWLVGVLQTLAGMSGDMPANVCRPSGRAPTGRCYNFRVSNKVGWLQFLSAYFFGLVGFRRAVGAALAANSKITRHR